jgi:hypothetical protein
MERTWAAPKIWARTWIAQARAIFLEFIRNRMAEVRTDDDGNIVAVNDLFGSFTWNSMIQARISPSGVLHVAQFGGASTVYRMNYVGNGQ